jgi:AcrR family transcriptional regulator
MMEKASHQKDRKKSNLIRKSEIHNKALDLFVKKGYDATSMSMIAKVLGMSKANLYYYCSSKEDLLYQIHLDDLRRRFIPILEKVERLPDPQDRLVFFLRSFALMCTSSPASQVLIHEIRNLHERHYYEITSIWRRAYKLVSDAIKELQELGKGHKYRQSFLTFLGTGMVFWIPYWFDYRRQVNAEELAETLVQIFLKGFLYFEGGGSIKSPN